LLDYVVADFARSQPLPCHHPSSCRKPNSGESGYARSIVHPTVRRRLRPCEKLSITRFPRSSALQ
jgi:hypothetical protein